MGSKLCFMHQWWWIQEESRKFVSAAALLLNCSWKTLTDMFFLSSQDMFLWIWGIIYIWTLKTKSAIANGYARQRREDSRICAQLKWTGSEKLTSSENSKARASTPQASNNQAASLCLCILCRGIFTTGTRCHLLAFAGGAVLSINHAIKSAHTMELTSVCREWKKKIRGRTRLC